MKLISAVLIILLSLQSFADDYIVVAVSGFRTIRDSMQSNNIFANIIDQNGEESGVWENAPTNADSKRIIQNAYLTHFSNDREIDSVINLFLDETKSCVNNKRMILMVNSWGAKISQRLAKKYESVCKAKPLMTFLIEGILKPTNFPYTSDLLSEECINIFQSKSFLRGSRINNCKNFKFTYPHKKRSFYDAHISAEWSGSVAAKVSILDFINGGERVFSITSIYELDGLKEIN